ncbi:hypothetical protein G6O67_008094 [Ophiocordyceps sinensis]|uniref:Uncharacterized protein n=1 Tax=Ophiocordyceps sinensis TaxID=72228 RepID=A0A8H4PKS5_9HYPO|nr:hypothetical protein G6O67_008094 [Ophiocordyceps sinensis]
MQLSPSSQWRDAAPTEGGDEMKATDDDVKRLKPGRGMNQIPGLREESSVSTRLDGHFSPVCVKDHGDADVRRTRPCA